MELINDKKSRLKTYHKRKVGVLKKAEQLSILCGIQTCVIIFGPESIRDQVAELVTFPENHNQVTTIINNFSGKQHSKSDNLIDNFAERKKNVDNEIAKLRKENMKSKFPSPGDFLNNLSFDQFKATVERLEHKLEAAKRKIQELIKVKMERYAVMMGDWGEESSTSQFRLNNNNNKSNYLHFDPSSYTCSPKAQQLPAYCPPNQILPMSFFGMNPSSFQMSRNNDEYIQSPAMYNDYFRGRNNNNIMTQQNVQIRNNDVKVKNGVLYNAIPITSVRPNNMHREQQSMVIPQQQHQCDQSIVMPPVPNDFVSLLNGKAPECND
ncbi:hypothetical protein ACFE04_007649 [Oxalis oulophora]